MSEVLAFLNARELAAYERFRACRKNTPERDRLYAEWLSAMSAVIAERGDRARIESERVRR